AKAIGAESAPSVTRPNFRKSEVGRIENLHFMKRRKRKARRRGGEARAGINEGKVWLGRAEGSAKVPSYRRICNGAERDRLRREGGVGRLSRARLGRWEKGEGANMATQKQGWNEVSLGRLTSYGKKKVPSAAPDRRSSRNGLALKALEA